MDKEVRWAKAQLPWVDQLPFRPWPAVVHPSVLEASNAQSLPCNQVLFVERLSLDSLDVEVIVVGTNHSQPSVAAAAERLITELQPHAVMVELCVNRAPAYFDAVSPRSRALSDRDARLASESQPSSTSGSSTGNRMLPTTGSGGGGAAELETPRPGGDDSEVPIDSHGVARHDDRKRVVHAPETSQLWRPAAVIVHPWLTKQHQSLVHVLPVNALGSGIADAASTLTDVSAKLNAQLMYANMMAAVGDGDMGRSAAAALNSGAMLFLGDLIIGVSRQRDAQEAAAAAPRPQAGRVWASVASASELMRATVMALTGNWHGVAAVSTSRTERERADAFAEGHYRARLAAALPQLDALELILHAAAVNLLVHGDAAPDAIHLPSNHTLADRAAVDLVARGRKAFNATAKLRWNHILRVACEGVDSYFLAQEADEQRKLAVELLLPDGRLRPEYAHAVGTPALARCRRAAAGSPPAGNLTWSRIASMALLAERDAILASSILHMRDAMERAAARACEAKLRAERAAALLAAAQAEAAGACEQHNLLTHTEQGLALAPAESALLRLAKGWLARAQSVLTHARGSPHADCVNAVSASSDADVPLGRRAAELVDDWRSPSPLAGKRLQLVAVVGSAHVPGVRRYLQAADMLAAQAEEHLHKHWREHDVTVASGGGGAGSIASESSSESAPGFDTAAAHAELVRQGFLPAQPFMPLHQMFPGQLNALAAANKPPSPADAAAAAAAAPRAGHRAKSADSERRAQADSEGDDRLRWSSDLPSRSLSGLAQWSAPPDRQAAAANALAFSTSRRALLRAVAACSVDEQIEPTLTADAGLPVAMTMKHTVAPLAFGAACLVLPLLPRVPLPLRIAALSVSTAAAVGAGAVLVAAEKVTDRLDTAMHAAGRRRYSA